MSFTDTEVDHQHQDIDRRPCIVICNWSGTEPVWDLIEDLTGIPWHPDNARTELVNRSTDVGSLAQDLVGRLDRHAARAILLIGRTAQEGPAQLQLRAEVPVVNGTRLDESSPGVVRATGPAASILQALADARVPATATSRSEADDGTELLYRIMTALHDPWDTPSVALLRFPPSMGESTIAPAVKAAACAMTQHMAPAPRFSAPLR